MFEQDYILRIIKEIIDTIMKTLFGYSDTASLPTIQDQAKQEMSDDLIRKIDNGEVLDALSILKMTTKDKTIDDLIVAYTFYTYLLSKDEDFFDENNILYSEMFDEMRRYFIGFGISEDILDLILMNK